MISPSIFDLIKSLHIPIFQNFKHTLENSEDPDQLASLEAS